MLKRETATPVRHADIGECARVATAVTVHADRRSGRTGSFDHALSATVTIEPLSRDLVVIAADGEFDIGNAHLIGDTVRIALERHHRQVIVDLRGTKFFDCAALNELMWAVGSLHGDPQAAVVLAGSRGIVQRFLDLVAVDRLLPLARTRLAAIEALQPRSADPDHQPMAT